MVLQCFWDAKKQKYDRPLKQWYAAPCITDHCSHFSSLLLLLEKSTVVKTTMVIFQLGVSHKAIASSTVDLPISRCGAVDKRRRNISIDRLRLLLPVCRRRRWGWGVRWLRWTHCPISNEWHSIGIVKAGVIVTLYADCPGYGPWKCGHCCGRYCPWCTTGPSLVRLHPCVSHTEKK